MFACDGPVVIYPASGTGAWEASAGEYALRATECLCFETGHFATLWRKMADKLGLAVDFVPGDWRSGVDAAEVESRLSQDRRPRDQGRARGSQRNIDGSHQPDPTHPPGDRPRLSSCIVDGRYHFVAWPRSTTGTRSGAWTSPSPARRKG